MQIYQIAFCGYIIVSYRPTLNELSQIIQMILIQMLQYGFARKIKHVFR